MTNDHARGLMMRVLCGSHQMHPRLDEFARQEVDE